MLTLVSRASAQKFFKLPLENSWNVCVQMRMCALVCVYRIDKTKIEYIVNEPSEKVSMYLNAIEQMNR